MMHQTSSINSDVSLSVLHDKEIIEKVSIFFENSINGYSLNKLLLNASGIPIDFEIIACNTIFKILTGTQNIDVVGKKYSEIFPDYINQKFNWLDVATPIALKNSKTRFNYFEESTQKWFNINMYSPEKGFFIAVFDDITKIKKSGIELRHKQEEIEILNNEFRKQNQELASRNEVLANLNDIHMQVIKELRDSIKKSEVMHQKLLDTESTARTIIDSASDIIILLDVKGVVLDCNESFLQKYNQEKSAVIGKNVFKLFTSDAAKFRLEQFERVIKTKEKIIINDFYDNSFFETVITPYISNEGLVSKVVIVARDIIERYEAQIELYESEKKYRLLAENSDDVIWTYDVEANMFSYVSPSVTKLLGFTSEETLNSEIFQIENSAGWYNFFVTIKERIKAVEDGDESQIVQTNVIEQKCKDGSVKPVEIVSKLIVNNNKKVIEILGISRDITERREIENQLKKALLHAEESDRLKSAFLANMSHEIRTPMNGIIGFADLLNNSNLSPEKITRYSEIININGRHLLSIINDIIDISKIEAGQVSVNESEININALLKELALFFISAKFRNQNVNVVLNSDISETDSLILTDDVKVKQILTNLISNALKFTSEGSVEISCKKTNHGNSNFLLFKVTDTGIGIAKGDQDIIFERFRQVDFTSERKYGGTGLGLPISKAYVELMGGQIWVDSNVGKGSTFYFTIPFKKVKSAKEDIVVQETLNQEVDWSGKKILIAEDENTNFLYLEEILRTTKAVVLHASNGVEAIKLCKENKDINIVLMDIKMPEMNGLEATKKIKSSKPNLPVIAQTAFALSDDLQKAIEAGCDDYIAKPILRDYLIEKLLRYI